MSGETSRAIQLLRDRADDMTAEIDSGHYYWQEQSFGVGVRGALGGSAGELGAMLDPAVAHALADLLRDASTVVSTVLQHRVKKVTEALLAANADR